ncbi:hypothetical protein SM124_13295 [Bacillus sp. 31A1R]|uniref:Uncharacterized protein n=1 Tax=Robertmurraya mangrovi TaxID=3098077 RepID=A0ABU5IZZ1_9BACI|nr:hypothetical protein [Bacillus sp. 31A1R]MDZ5472707.1 hypothetical protein [Bacillus sp. 31A1R]
MLLIGESINLDQKITSNIQTSFYNGKVVPCLIYQGHYIKEVNDKIQTTKTGLKEIIEEVIVSTNENSVFPSFLVTRQIGTDNPNSGIPKDKPQTRVSLIYVENNDIRVWTPTNKEIIKDLKFLCEHAGKQYMAIFKEINNILGTREDFSVQQLVDSFVKEAFHFPASWSPFIRGSFNDRKVPVAALFCLIKNILVSEDMRFDGSNHLGRYRFQVAALDHVLGNKPIDDIL